MTEAEVQVQVNSQGHGSENSFGDHMIALFSSVSMAYMAYFGLWLLVLVYKWIPSLVGSVKEFKLAFKLLVENGWVTTIYTPVDSFPITKLIPSFALDLDLFFYIPLVFGIIIGLINYGKVLQLKDE